MSRFTPARIAELVATVALTLLAIAAFTQSHAEDGPVRASGQWMKAPVTGIEIAAGYLMLTNGGSGDDRLKSATSPAAKAVELHDMSMEGGVMRMRRMEQGAPVPAGGTLTFGPHGMHLMFIGVKPGLKAGDTVPVTLAFEKAGEMTVDFPVLAKAPNR